MPRRKRTNAIPDDQMQPGRHGSYAFAKSGHPGAKGELPPPDTKYTVELIVPEMAVLQYSMRALITTVEELIPEGSIYVEGDWKRVRADPDNPQLMAQLAILAVASEALNHLIEASRPMDIIHGPDGSIGVTTVDPEHYPGPPSPKKAN